MGVVSTWLSNIGLNDAVPAFRTAGITTPAELALLELDQFEELGITSTEDRKKLFYLVQRIKMAVAATASVDHMSGADDGDEVEEEEEQNTSDGDGGDDEYDSYEEEDSRGAKPTGPPSKNARDRSVSNSERTRAGSGRGGAASASRRQSRPNAAPAPIPAASSSSSSVRDRRRTMKSSRSSSRTGTGTGTDTRDVNGGSVEDDEYEDDFETIESGQSRGKAKSATAPAPAPAPAPASAREVRPKKRGGSSNKPSVARSPFSSIIGDDEDVDDDDSSASLPIPSPPREPPSPAVDDEEDTKYEGSSRKMDAASRLRARARAAAAAGESRSGGKSRRMSSRRNLQLRQQQQQQEQPSPSPRDGKNSTTTIGRWAGEEEQNDGEELSTKSRSNRRRPAVGVSAMKEATSQRGLKYGGGEGASSTTVKGRTNGKSGAGSGRGARKQPPPAATATATTRHGMDRNASAADRFDDDNDVTDEYSMSNFDSEEEDSRGGVSEAKEKSAEAARTNHLRRRGGGGGDDVAPLRGQEQDDNDDEEEESYTVLSVSSSSQQPSGRGTGMRRQGSQRLADNDGGGKGRRRSQRLAGKRTNAASTTAAASSRPASASSASLKSASSATTTTTASTGTTSSRMKLLQMRMNDLSNDIDKSVSGIESEAIGTGESPRRTGVGSRQPTKSRPHTSSSRNNKEEKDEDVVRHVVSRPATSDTGTSGRKRGKRDGVTNDDRPIGGGSSRRNSMQKGRRRSSVGALAAEAWSKSCRSTDVSEAIVHGNGSKGEGQGVASADLSDSSSAGSRQRRHQSKIQHPSVSSRFRGGSNATDGKKRLSSIPSGIPAPVSPLHDISSLHDQQDRQEVREQKSTTGSRRQSTSGARMTKKEARSRRSSEPLAPVRSSSNSRSAPGVKRRGSLSRSNSSTSRSSRRSLGPVQCSLSRSVSPAPVKKSPLRQRANNMSKSDKRDTSASEKDERKTNKCSSAVFIHGQPEDDSWATMVSYLREEKTDHFAAMHENGYDEEDENDEDMRIRVIVRKRPMSRKEKSSGEVDIIHPIEQFGRVLVYQPKVKLDLTKEIESSTFAYDDVFCEDSTNAGIYERSVKDLIPGVFDRKWVSVFAYGQTGSGKTFTMMGSSLTGIKDGKSRGLDESANLGLYFLAAQDVFRYAATKEFSHLSVSVSLFEIYGGKLFDLLNGRKQVKCLEDHKGKVCFPGLSEHAVHSPEDLLNVIAAGAMNRSMGTTSANADSSRSHAVLQLSLRKIVGSRRNNVEHGRLTFIDLAGSERGADTNNAGRTTRLEGAEINTSLLALKEVIRALATGGTMQHIPFRGSKLTQVLKESFVGANSRTVMITCVAPNMSNCEHTMNTLRYADRVKERNPESGMPAVAPTTTSSTRNKDMRRVSVGNSSVLARPTTAPVARQRPSATYSCKESSEEDLASFADDSFSGDDELIGDDSFLFDELVDHPSGDDFDEDSDPPMPPSPEREVSEISIDAEPEAMKEGSANDVFVEITGGQDAQENMQRRIMEAAKPLVANHRATMTGMLGMVKNEMLLVNSTDADRDNIDDYMTEIEKLQGVKLDMISSLRQSLAEFYSARNSILQEHRQTTRLSEDPLSDDTFEDLRD